MSDGELVTAKYVSIVYVCAWTLLCTVLSSNVLYTVQYKKNEAYIKHILDEFVLRLVIGVTLSWSVY
jgi:hypothetical protein